MSGSAYGVNSTRTLGSSALRPASQVWAVATFGLGAVFPELDR